MSGFMHNYLVLTLILLGILALFALLYVVLGKRFTDKIVATNILGTLGVNIIVILGIVIGTDYILDIGLVFALLSFLMVIVLCRFVNNRAVWYNDGKEKDPNVDGIIQRKREEEK